MATWILRKQFRFEAAHHLPHHDGPCARVHGHSWCGWIEVRGQRLQTSGPKQGMLVDYSVLKAIIDPLVQIHLDHQDLNQSLDLASPTSEEIARWILDYIRDFPLPEDVRISAIEIEETCTAACRFEP